jgi:hypothetical protein
MVFGLCAVEVCSFQGEVKGERQRFEVGDWKKREGERRKVVVGSNGLEIKEENNR